VKASLALLFCLALLATGMTPRGAAGQVVVSLPVPDVGLGFGPSSIQPISLGVPVYTQGDNLWLESYYNSTVDVTLLTPQGLDKTGVVVVEPGQLFMLYSFNGADPNGPWVLSVTSYQGVTDVFVYVYSPDGSLRPAYDGARLNGNELNQTFTLPPTDASNVQLCSVGQEFEHAFGFGLAGGLNGTVEVSLAGNSSQFGAIGISSPLSMWLELYSQYSYITGSGGTVSQNLLVATTPVISASPPRSNEQVSLLQQMPIRQGRFDVRVFDRTASGLALHDAEFLRTVNGTWVPLSSCTSRENAYSSVLPLITNLDSANSTWPRQLLTMYTIAGVESYSESTIPGGEAALHFRDFPDGNPLTGVVFSPSEPGTQELQWDAANSSVYLLTSSYPSDVSIRLSFSGIAFEALNMSILAPYTSKSFYVDAGTLVVSATQQGGIITNATLSVGAQGSRLQAVKPSAAGSASILLPPGAYNVSASYGGVSASKLAAVTPGHISSVSLDLTQQSVPVDLYLLAGLGAAGLAANIYLWRLYLQRRRTYG
jgi:hypothetical protein